MPKNVSGDEVARPISPLWDEAGLDGEAREEMETGGVGTYPDLIRVLDVAEEALLNLKLDAQPRLALAARQVVASILNEMYYDVVEED